MGQQVIDKSAACSDCGRVGMGKHVESFDDDTLLKGNKE